jgi:hypothetical protein
MPQTIHGFHIGSHPVHFILWIHQTTDSAFNIREGVVTHMWVKKGQGHSNCIFLIRNQFKAQHIYLQVICNSKQFKLTIFQVWDCTRANHWHKPTMISLSQCQFAARYMEHTYHLSTRTMPDAWISGGTSRQTYLGILITWMVISKSNCHWQSSCLSFNP